MTNVTILHLPVEILTRIAYDTRDLPQEKYNQDQTRLEKLKNLRLSCKTFANVGAQSLFEQVSLYPDQESHDRLYALQKHTKHCCRVRTVIVCTSTDPDQDVDDQKNEDPDVDVEEDFEEAVSTISKFPNLSSIVLHFRSAVTDEENTFYAVPDDISFRTEFLTLMFSTFNNTESPIPNLRSLTIKNLQDFNSAEVTTSPAFTSILSRLTELHLHIATEYDTASPETSISHSCLHTFFAQLPQTWLYSTQPNLTHLTLYTDTYWGWAPSFDPRLLHFPNLKTLSLGNFTFAHDWHHSWITSHASTLETLILDDCPILFYIYPFDCLQENTDNTSHDNHDIFLHHPKSPGSQHLNLDDSRYTYSIRWHHLFSTFATVLTNLTKFVYSSGDWPNAFPIRNQLLPYLWPKRYIAFNGGIGPSHWVEMGPEDKATVGHGDDKVGITSPATVEPPFRLAKEGQAIVGSLWAQEHKGCGKEDEDAFLNLLRTVQRRTRAKGLD